MRAVRLLGPALFLAGVLALTAGFLHGQANLSLFVVFPVITATGGWSGLGILLMIAGFFVFFLTWPAANLGEPQPVAGPGASGTPPEASAPAPSRRWGGVVFLGPIPIVFGSDPKIARWMILVGILLFLGLVVLTLVSLRGI